MTELLKVWATQSQYGDVRIEVEHVGGRKWQAIVETVEGSTKAIGMLLTSIVLFSDAEDYWGSL